MPRLTPGDLADMRRRAHAGRQTADDVLALLAEVLALLSDVDAAEARGEQRAARGGVRR
jgi:hypothetical protein